MAQATVCYKGHSRYTSIHVGNQTHDGRHVADTATAAPKAERPLQASANDRSGRLDAHARNLNVYESLRTPGVRSRSFYIAHWLTSNAQCVVVMVTCVTSVHACHVTRDSPVEVSPLGRVAEVLSQSSATTVLVVRQPF